MESKLSSIGNSLNGHLVSPYHWAIPFCTVFAHGTFIYAHLSLAHRSCHTMATSSRHADCASNRSSVRDPRQRNATAPHRAWAEELASSPLRFLPLAGATLMPEVKAKVLTASIVVGAKPGKSMRNGLDAGVLARGYNLFLQHRLQQLRQLELVSNFVPTSCNLRIHLSDAKS